MRDRQEAWLAIISGERRGAVAALARAGLSVLAGLYRAGLACHDLRLWLPGAVKHVPRPVVSVGNLTVGGTGKTPMVAYLARLVSELGARPLIVSRGYRAGAGALNDEARELEGLCPGVPHVQNSDRRAAILGALAQSPCDLVILDDGFQHRRLGRDLDIVLVDALRPFGCGAGDSGRVLPRGILREPLSALRRADLVAITRAEMADGAELGRVRSTLSRFLRPGAPLLLAAHHPAALRLADGSRREAESLRGQAVAAACGIGNPQAFRRTLEGLGASVNHWQAFPDHYTYEEADLDRLIRRAQDAGLKMLVTTGKDFVKWRSWLSKRSGTPVEVAALEVELRIVEGADVLRQRLGALLAR